METPEETDPGGARTLIEDYLHQTGITGPVIWRGRRYLWTDAFAVQACFGLARILDAPVYRKHALELIEAVHAHLGRHRTDDLEGREGWLSGLPEKEGLEHPTLGGLRIGKSQPERPPGEAGDERLEWEQDGQYFHYLTRWMQALMRAWYETEEDKFATWAAELAEASAAFVIDTGVRMRMYWKMSIDLSRPLVASMGAHDPLDGLICVDEIRRELPDRNTKLTQLQAKLAALCEGKSWATPDALGIGGLLLNLSHLSVLEASGEPVPEPLRTEDLLLDSLQSLEIFRQDHSSEAPPEQRLAFRECGLSLGLRVFDGCLRTGLFEQFQDARLKSNESLAGEIETFWADPENREASTWTEHENINRVMLAASLVAADEPSAFSLPHLRQFGTDPGKEARSRNSEKTKHKSA
ncbi:MAG: hypothetical protein ACOC4K_04670 [Verrucomicrobiota bacterium]